MRGEQKNIGMGERSLQHVSSVGILVFIGKGARFLVLIVMARLLTPHDFGVFAVFSLALSITYVFYKNSVTNILVQRKDLLAEDIDTIAFTALIFSVAAALFFVLMAQPLAVFFDNASLQRLFYLVPIFLILQGVSSVAIGLLSREHKLVEVERSQTLYSTLVNLAFSLLLALLGLGFMALVIGLLLGELLGTLRLYSLLQRKFSVKFHRHSLLKIKPALKSYYFISLVSNFNQYVDQILIGKFLGLAAVGIYTRAVQLREYPLFVFSKTVVRVLFPVLADIQQSSQPVKAAMLKTLNLSLLLLLPITVFLTLEAEAIVLTLLGEQWSEVVPVMTILMLGVPSMVCSGIFHSALKAANHESVIAKFLAVYYLVLLISLFVGARYGASGIAIAVTFTAGVHCINYAVYYGHIMSISCLEYLAVLRAGALLAVISAIVLYGVAPAVINVLPVFKLLLVASLFTLLNSALLFILPSRLISKDALWLRQRIEMAVRSLIQRTFTLAKV